MVGKCICYSTYVLEHIAYVVLTRITCLAAKHTKAVNSPNQIAACLCHSDLATLSLYTEFFCPPSEHSGQPKALKTLERIQGTREAIKEWV